MPVPAIESNILVVRGQRVMLDAGLAGLYGVEVRALNQAVRRNRGRFPADFMFQLTWEETAALRSQIVILEKAGPSGSGRRHNRELARRLDALESRYDRQFKVVFDAIRELMAPPAQPKRKIGFVSSD